MRFRFVQEIIDIRQPAAKGGLHVGDLPWRYGTWSFPDALAAERAKGTSDGAILEAFHKTGEIIRNAS